MPKKAKIKLQEVIKRDNLGSISTVSINLTTDKKSNYEIVSSKFMPAQETLAKVKYGTGPLAYEGYGDSEHTMLSAASKDGENYLIRAVGDKAVAKLSKIVGSESAQLEQLKISNAQGLGGILVPTGINAEDLIPKAIQSQQNLASKRIKVSVSADGVFMIGTKSSTKSFEIGLAKDDSSQARPCLSILSNIRETKGSYVNLMAAHNVELTDVHVLALRDAVQGLNDCQLKEIIL